MKESRVAIAAVVAFVAYGEYIIWFKSPIAQVSAICDKFRTLKEAAAARLEGAPCVAELAELAGALAAELAAS